MLPVRDDHVQQEHSMMMLAPLKAEMALLTLFATRVLLLLGPSYFLFTSFSALVPLVEGAYSDISRDDTTNEHDRSDLADNEDNMDNSEDIPSEIRKSSLPRRNKKRILTNTKLFYFLQNPPRQLSTSESRRSLVTDQIADKSDCN